jgi:hypothetical protein
MSKTIRVDDLVTEAFKKLYNREHNGHSGDDPETKFAAGMIGGVMGFATSVLALVKLKEEQGYKVTFSPIFKQFGEVETETI